MANHNGIETLQFFPKIVDDDVELMDNPLGDLASCTDFETLKIENERINNVINFKETLNNNLKCKDKAVEVKELKKQKI